MSYQLIPGPESRYPRRTVSSWWVRRHSAEIKWITCVQLERDPDGSCRGKLTLNFDSYTVNQDWASFDLLLCSVHCPTFSGIALHVVRLEQGEPRVEITKCWRTPPTEIRKLRPKLETRT